MLNLKEWGKVLISILIGAVIGVVISLVLPFYDCFAEQWNCLCSYCLELPRVRMSFNLMKYIVIVTSSIGLIVGFFSALAQRNERVQAENIVKYGKNYTELIAEMNKVLSDVNAPTKKSHELIDSIKYELSDLNESYTMSMSDCNQRIHKAEYYLNEFKLEVSEEDTAEEIVEETKEEQTAADLELRCPYCGAVLRNAGQGMNFCEFCGNPLSRSNRA